MNKMSGVEERFTQVAAELHNLIAMFKAIEVLSSIKTQYLPIKIQTDIERIIEELDDLREKEFNPSELNLTVVKSCLYD